MKIDHAERGSGPTRVIEGIAVCAEYLRCRIGLVQTRDGLSWALQVACSRQGAK